MMLREKNLVPGAIITRQRHYGDDTFDGYVTAWMIVSSKVNTKKRHGKKAARSIDWDIVLLRFGDRGVGDGVLITVNLPTERGVVSTFTNHQWTEWKTWP